ncbi:WD40 repeat domain-containing protein [Amycolatopsis mediterranei]|uniref:WD40 repeat domain-containing protein n=3 Tax=Amycolatopsis mediterranei TaxID=33910 RepID=UPI00031E9746|nr:WD40 repeat domain-containing protein [Amycolatopsis mediterranei]UZF70601.1 WD40 repeat domain-containing protein [Amycolatopsis mediterranei]
MPRREQPLGRGNESVVAFAADLRALRAGAGNPAYRELGRRVHYSAASLSEAASGRKLPSLPVTLAYVRGCAGDVAAWERRWRQVAEELASEPSSVEADEQEPPYIGLSAFRPENAATFFGRTRLVEEVLQRLVTHRLVGVFGPSGAGKSSLLQAGVIARWQEPARNVVMFTPGEHPSARLDTLPPGDGETLIVVDQFEEVYTRCQDATERDEFIARLVGLADEADGRCHIVLGVRADFYGHCMDSPHLLAHLRDAQVAVGAMTAEELREVIVEPAALAGARVESSLLSTLVAQVSGHAGMLPLLSHALLETWRRRRGNTLTLSSFEAAGGIDGALAKTAEDVYAGFEPDQQLLVRRLFLRLTAVSEDVGDVTARAGLDELDGDPGLTFVLERLAAARLVMLDKGSIEMTHETLLRSWPRLREWLAEDREGRRVHRQLTEAANTWESLDQDSGALYRGVRLDSAGEWVNRTSEQLTVRERQFLDASFAAREQEKTRERRQRLRLRQLVAVLSVLLLLAVAAGVYAFKSEVGAARDRNIAVSQRAAIEASAERAAHPALSAQLALAAYHISPTPEARGALLSTFGAPYATQLHGHRGAVGGVAYSADGTLMASASMDNTIRLYDVHEPHHPEMRAELAGHLAGVNGVVFGRGVLASVSWDHTVRIWDIGNPAHPGDPITLTGHSDCVNAVAVTADGKTLATGSTDHTVRIWDLSDPEHPVPMGDPLTRHTDTVLSVAFRRDGKLLATSSSDQTIRLWDTTDPRHPVAVGAPLTGHSGDVSSIAFSPDGHSLVSGGADQTLRLWDVTDPAHATQTASAFTRAAVIRAVAFAPDGRTVAAASTDQMVRLWAVGKTELSELITFAGHAGAAYSAAFSPDGHTLATGSDDRTVRLWDVAGTLLGGHTNAVYHVALSPDGKAVATAGYDGTVLVRKIATGDKPIVLTAHQGPVNSVAFAPDGRTMASASADHTVRLWDTHDLSHITPLGQALPGFTDAVNTVAYSHDGKILAAGGSNRVAVLLDVSDPRAPHTVATIPVGAGIQELAISPDGRRLAAAGDDSNVWMWDITHPTGLLVPSLLSGHNSDVKSVAFSPDGHFLASASRDATVRLWDLDNPRGRDKTPVNPSPDKPLDLTGLIVHPDVVYSVAFSGDGATLASAAADGRVRLWDVHDRDHPTALADLTGHTDRVYSVAFGPDGHTLASAGQDHTARLWDIDPGVAGARVCMLADSPVDRTTWDRYFPGIAYNPPC